MCVIRIENCPHILLSYYKLNEGLSLFEIVYKISKSALKYSYFISDFSGLKSLKINKMRGIC